MFASAISRHPIPATAVGEAAGEILDKLPTPPDVLLLFVSVGFAGALEDIANAVQRLLEPKAMIGCVADGVVGVGIEVVDDDALGIWAASGFDANAFYTDHNESAELLANSLPDGEHAVTVLLTDPRTYRAQTLFNEANRREVPPLFVGGYVHDANNFAPNQLVYGGKVIGGGAVGVTIPRGKLDLTVGHGARPIGSPLVITSAESQTIYELAGAPAVAKLTEILRIDIDEDDLALVGEGLLLGRVVDEHSDKFQVGDFTVHFVLNSDPLSGSITVSDALPVGSIVQFHVRDSVTANISMLRSLGNADAVAALLFSSKERGFKLFEEPSHDAGTIADRMNNPPTAGIVTSREFEQVADINVVNTMSASILLFRR